MEKTICTEMLFSEIVQKICSRETSVDPVNWSEECPLQGHCAIVSLLAQDIFGGVILRQSLDRIHELAHIRSHYINMFPDWVRRDFTAGQFVHKLPADIPTEIRSRDEILSHPDTGERYRLIKVRFMEKYMQIP